MEIQIKHENCDLVEKSSPEIKTEYLDDTGNIKIEKVDIKSEPIEEFNSKGNTCFKEVQSKHLEHVEVCPEPKDTKEITSSDNYTAIDNTKFMEINASKYSTYYFNDLYRNSLTKPIKICSSDKPFQCKKCNYRCVRSFDMERHIMAVHIIENPYKCEICKCSYSQNSHLQRHLLTHTGEKPYKCEICQRSYLHKNNLTLHMFVHSDKRLFYCEICNYSSIRRYELQRHMSVHSEEKPFECDLCSRKYSQKSYLNRHKLAHCKKRFMTI